MTDTASIANAKMTPRELDKIAKVPAETAEDLIKVIRLLAMTGKRLFLNHLFTPLDFKGWKRRPGSETVRRLMEHIDRALSQPGSIHTAGPLARRMISAALNDSLSALGDASIFFLDRMQRSSRVAASPDAIDFVQTVYPPLIEFRDMHQLQSEQLFAEGLQALSQEDLREAFRPIQLGRHTELVEVQRQAINLFHRIKLAAQKDDFERCIKLISHYLINYGDQENNNRDEVERLISALSQRAEGFRSSLEERIAINLFYEIQNSIAANDLRRTIRAIRKYAHIFQGEPGIRYFHEIDKLEQWLYALITEKDLWKELKAERK